MPRMRAAAHHVWNGVVRGWRVFTPRHTNVALDTVSLFAITRGVLYGFGPQPRDPVPRGLDLLSSWALYVYGVFWLLTGIYGVITARGRHDIRQNWARWFLTGLCLVWAACYFFGAIIPSDTLQVKSAVVVCIVYLILARLAWWKAGAPRSIRTQRTLFVLRNTGSIDMPVFQVTKQEPIPETADDQEAR